jgi:quinol monooxygenase YgiN
MKPTGKTVFVTARVLAKPDFTEKVKAACLALVEPSRRDRGCVSYELFQSRDEPDLFIFFEEWETMKDLENHLAASHAAEFDRATRGLLLEDEEIIYLSRLT